MKASVAEIRLAEIRLAAKAVRVLDPLHDPAAARSGGGRPFYLFFGALLVAGGVGNLLSGLFIRRQIYRLFSLIVAGINCLQFPFGTALGVFTFIVLLRDSVRERYDPRNGTCPSPV